MNGATSTGAGTGIDALEYNCFAFYINASSVTTGGTVKIQTLSPAGDWVDLSETAVTANGDTLVTKDGAFLQVRANVTARTDGTYTVTMEAKEGQINETAAAAENIVSTESLVSFWKLDESSGTRYDFFGSSDLTDNNSVGQATSLTGVPYTEAADLIESNSEYLSRADEAANQFGDEDFTIACWVRLETGGAAPLVSKWSSVSNNRSYTLQATSRHGGNVFELVVSSNGNLSSEGTDWEWVGDLGGYSTGTWYFLVCGHDSVNNEIFFSQNDGTMQTKSWSAGVNTGSNVFEIGRYVENIVQLSDGTFGPVMMFRRVLSSTEITALANKDDPFYDQF